jgi:PadR family transcriptional regulator, regulatory protein PadR
MPYASLDNLGKPPTTNHQPPTTNRIMGIRQIDLLQGTLDLLILKSLSVGANHGYGIATRIHQLSDDVLKVEEGSLYPALYRMEEQGLIDSEWSVTENNRKAKFYKLTRKGRTAAQAEVDGWLRLSSAVTKVLRAIEQRA